jgi:lipopolysaccharide/colanic/teichoic acid biosynthesis glycosyltransferase
MNTFAAPASSRATLLWDEALSGISDHTKSLVPRLLTISRDRTECFVEPSAWSVSPFRRGLDFVTAALALLLSWPLLLLAALLVRLESPGPVIFRQERVGRRGKLFTVYKFRTMDVAAQQEGPSMTKSGDPRITRFGRFLRKHKLDELPQLFNVVRGDMSLVGPRPRLPHHMEEMDLPVRPGLTGAATLVFRCEEEMLRDIPDHELETYNCRTIIPLKAKLDWDYMNRATMASDFTLLYKTAACCISTCPECFRD